MYIVALLKAECSPVDMEIAKAGASPPALKIYSRGGAETPFSSLTGKTTTEERRRRDH